MAGENLTKTESLYVRACKMAPNFNKAKIRLKRIRSLGYLLDDSWAYHVFNDLLTIWLKSEENRKVINDLLYKMHPYHFTEVNNCNFYEKLLEIVYYKIRISKIDKFKGLIHALQWNQESRTNIHNFRRRKRKLEEKRRKKVIV